MENRAAMAFPRLSLFGRIRAVRVSGREETQEKKINLGHRSAGMGHRSRTTPPWQGSIPFREFLRRQNFRLTIALRSPPGYRSRRISSHIKRGYDRYNQLQKLDVVSLATVYNLFPHLSVEIGNKAEGESVMVISAGPVFTEGIWWQPCTRIQFLEHWVHG